MSLRVHLLAPPNGQTTRAFGLDGFLQTTINFARLLTEHLNARVILYASEDNDAPCEELVTVITKDELRAFQSITVTAESTTWTPWAYQDCNWSHASPLFQLMNGRVVPAIGQRKQPGDVICSIHGGCHGVVADEHKELPFIEYSIGYPGTLNRHRVFQSRAWQHACYGREGMQDFPAGDAVIPPAYDPDEFTWGRHKEPFVVYCGRLIPKKGIDIAAQAAQRAGLPLKIIGWGDLSLVPPEAEYLGALYGEDRNAVLARAQACILPTIYLEPFNQVGVEAQMCGTPVVATDWGGFTETIKHGVSGYRCRTVGEFAEALRWCGLLDPAIIRDRAERTYSLKAVAPQFEAYFRRILR